MPAEPLPARPAATPVALPGQRLLAIMAGLVLLVLAAYSQVRTHEFLNFDDDVYVTANPAVRAGLTPDSVRWAFTTTHGGHWHPLTWLSLMASVELHGVRPAPLLLTNVALHAVNACLLFALLTSLTGRRWPSAFVAAAFALHPMRVESVAWVTERKDVQSVLFFLLALHAYVRWARVPGASRYAWTSLWLALGLLTKPMLVSAPAVMLLLDAWPLRRLGWPPAPAVLLEKVPLLLMALASSATAMWSQRVAGAMVEGTAVPLAERLANAAHGYAVYLRQLVWPRRLSVFYPLEPVPTGAAVAAASILVVLTAIAWRLRASRPYLLFGWLWYLVTALPVIGLVQVGGQAHADRFTYIPHVGLLVAIAWLAADAVAGHARARPALAAAAGLVLAALAVTTWRQVGFWRDSETLFAHALEATPENFMAHTNLAAALERRGDVAEAAHHYAQALRLNPHWPEAQNNMGNVRAREGRYAEAEQHYLAALRVRPAFPEAQHNLALARSQAAAAAAAGDEGGYARGNRLAREGRFVEAEAAYRAALRARPAWPEAHHHLGIALAAQGRAAEAVEAFETALKLAPALPAAAYNRGVALADLGRTREAAESFRRELRRDPGATEAALQLAWLLVLGPDRGLHDPQEAVRWGEKAAASLGPGDPLAADVWTVLAAAYREAGRPEEATAAEKRAAEPRAAPGVVDSRAPRF